MAEAPTGNRSTRDKARDRARRQANGRWRRSEPRSHEPSIEAVVDAAVASCVGRDPRPRAPRPELLSKLADRSDQAADALGRALLAAVTAAWQRHWQPADLPRAVAHACGTDHGRLAAEAVVREVRAYGPGVLPPGWQNQVDAIDPGTGDLDLGLAADTDPGWAVPGRSDHRRLERLALAVETLTFLRALPRLPKIGPLPGEPTVAAAPPSSVDPAVLHRVTSLLAKAESTSFPEEAEALTAKAQELMARHAIDRALVEARRRDGPGAPQATARRLGIDAPYAGAKAILLQGIAEANRCRAVWSKDLAFSTVFGDETDLDTVELLYTSLLVQAARAMLAASPPRRAAGRTRSFRQSFLVSFASRIGDRLRDAVAEAVRTTDDAHREALLPVLASRETDADDASRRAFPSTRTARTTANDIAGRQAGRDAADRALLDLHDGIQKGGDDTTMDKALRRGQP